MVKRVLIRFAGDNDFGWLMREFGELIMRFKVWSRGGTLTKETIIDLFNDVSEPLYKFLTGDDMNPVGYLRIDEEQVFIDKEVDEKMLSYSSWGNHDSVYVDLENGQIDVI